MRTYELMTIHRPELSDEQVRSLINSVSGFLDGRGSKVANTDVWGKRRFAYEINHLSEGYYSVMTFESDPETVSELDRVLTIADEVVRHKVIRLTA